MRRAIRRADGLYSAAPSVNEKPAPQRCRASVPRAVLATAVDLNRNVVKAAVPTVCFIGRLDRRKAAATVLRAGAAVSERAVPGRWQVARCRSGRRSCARVAGTCRISKMLGFVDQFQSARLYSILSQSWILANTSVREGVADVVPRSARESLRVAEQRRPGRRYAGSSTTPCAMTTSRRGLRRCSTNDAWREKGAAGWEYVRESFEIESVIEQASSGFIAQLIEPERGPRIEGDNA